MRQRFCDRGLTIVEVAVVIVVLAVGVMAFAAAQSALSEESRTAKCMSNLKRGINAVMSYTVEHDGVLPGPVHPAIFRLQYEDATGSQSQRTRSLTWPLGPYLTPGNPTVDDSTIANTEADEIFRCPTASLISPDRFFASIPFNYVCNTWGPIASPGTTVPTSSTRPYSTDPPNYFGSWFLFDSTPVSSSRSWWPKRLDSIRNAGAEWALADAWYRRIPPPPPRAGTIKRQLLGTFPTNFVLAEIPSAPYHRVNIREAKSHRAHNTDILPETTFEGETNQAYFDGHVAPFVGNWVALGEGGTVNPYWQRWSGEHLSTEIWYP